jgi:hypothetical protein
MCLRCERLEILVSCVSLFLVFIQVNALHVENCVFLTKKKVNARMIVYSEFSEFLFYGTKLVNANKS